MTVPDEAGRRRIWPALVVAAAVAAGALALVLAVRGGEQAAPVPDGDQPEITAAVRLVPRILQFGDTLVANVDVTVDRRAIDPGSIRVRQEFSPWALAGEPRRTRHDSGPASLVRTSYTLRCTIGPCVPPRETAPLEFDPARVTYRRTDRRPTEPLLVRWPDLVVHSNLVTSDLERPDAVAQPWKADLVSFPVVSYTVSPGLLRWLLVAAGTLLLLVGAALAYLAVPRKLPDVEPEPEPEPEPDISPLERALVLLMAPAPPNGAADHRRALELVAEEMEDGGDLRIARRARMLAWSEETPTVDETAELALSVRAWLAEHAPIEDEGTDGDVTAEEEAESHAPA